MTIWKHFSARAFVSAKTFLSTKALRIGFVGGLSGLVLAGCGQRSDVQAQAPKSQVVAKIGDQVVTVQELDNELRLANIPVEMRKDPATVKRVLGELVTRKYMVQQALAAKLDREPTVLLEILRSRELVLANALVSRDVTTKSASISKAEIDNYITDHPLRFANREALSIEQISIPMNSTSLAVIDATREMKTLDEVDQKLSAMGVQHSRSTGAITSGDLPQDLLDKIMAKQVDDIFFLRAGSNGIFFKITGQEPRPLEGEAANNAARQYLRQDMLKSEIGITSVSANLDARYEGEYADMMGQTAVPPAK
jgi:EpsD family peptidyl-prolyl cis-trans isomerase